MTTPHSNNFRAGELCLLTQSVPSRASQVSSALFFGKSERFIGRTEYILRVQVPSSPRFHDRLVNSKRSFFWPNVNVERTIGRNPESFVFCFRHRGDQPCEPSHILVCGLTIKSTIRSIGRKLHYACSTLISKLHTVSRFGTILFSIWFVSIGPTPTSYCAASADSITGNASFYSVEACKFNHTKQCLFADGTSLYTAEDRGVLYAAMWNVPFGTRLKVTNLKNGKSVIVVIKDRGPAKRLRRVIDLSKAAFLKIADAKRGVIKVKIEEVQ